MENLINSFKNRTIDYTKKVYVYRNLNCKSNDVIYSIMQDGLVVGHSSHFAMYKCEFIVRPAGKNKARQTKKRNVHAFIKGYLDYNISLGGSSYKLKYNPFLELGFTLCNEKSNKQILRSDLVWISKNEIICEAESAIFEKKMK